MTFLRKLWSALRLLVPFGLFVSTKPRHFREMLRIVWDNRRELPYALRILRHGVCDGCSLGPRGLRDDVLPGVHLCLTRLSLLSLNTMREIPEAALSDVDALRALSNEELHRLGRIPWPLLRRPGERGFSRLSWEEATELVAKAFRDSDPDRVGMFVTSRGLTNESYYALQKLMRVAGSPHVDSCARLCHAASAVGLKQTIGWGAPTLSLSDLAGTKLVIVIGSNLPNNQPVSTKYLRAARLGGGRVVVVNPFREPALERYWIPSVPTSALFGTKLMDDYFPVRPGGDIAFLSGVLKALDEMNGWDEAFLRERTTGAEALREHLRHLSWSEIVADSGVLESEIRRLAAMYGAAESAVIVYSMGLTQYEFGVENVKMVVNLALARGMIGKKNSGILPIRGHSGVQGTAECGADADKLPGAVDITEESCARFEAAWNHPIPHRKGLRAAHLLDRAGEQGLSLLYLVGGNHLETMPDRKHAKRALENVSLRVHQDIVLNTTTLLDAKGDVLLLPAETRYEQRSGGTSTSTERRIRFTPEIPGPRIAGAKPEWEIPALVGRALFPDREDLFPWKDTKAVREEMARVMPLYAGIEKLEKEGDWVQWGGERLGADGFPNMPDGRALFSVVKIPRIDVPEGRLLLTMRRGKQFNSMTRGDRDPLTSGSRRTDVLLDVRDLAALGLHEGDTVRVSSDDGSMTAHVKAGPCRAHHVQAFWPEANVLLGRRYDPASGEPDYATTVSIERVASS
ncbi:MAG TPA: molybdopterin-dependent oxidoreductase [Polyangiaceae bacterium]|nr:molybdopterin-dependent oxidoreductase [Polyangiaceae bacterium]